MEPTRFVRIPIAFVRSFHVIALAAVVSALGLCTTMCSSEDPSNPPTTTGDVAGGRFRGVLSTPGDVSGVLDITSTASGAAPSSLRPKAVGSTSYSLAGTLTLNIPGLGPVALSGTLDLNSNTAKLTGTAGGGAITFEGTYAAGVVKGKVTSPYGSGPFSFSNEQLGIKTYCGSFAGALSGRWSMIATGNQIGAVFATATEAGVGQGTVSAGLVSLSLSNLELAPSGTATGTESAGRIEGTYEYKGQRGSFATSESQCNALTPAGTLPDGGVLPDGGGTDAGPIGTPEVVYDAKTTEPIGAIAIGGTRLFYSIDFPYFSGKLRIGAVGTDGSTPLDVVPINDPLTESKAPVGGLTATASTVFYLGGTNPPSNDTNLYSVASDGGAVTDHGIIGGATGRDFVNGVSRLLNDGTNVFLSFYSTSTAQVRSFTLAGAPAGTLANLVGASGIALDGGDVLFGEFAGVQRIAKSLSGSPTVVSASSEYGNTMTVVNLAADATHVYFLGNSSTASAIWRKPKAGGALEPVAASGPGRWRGLVMVGPSLYFLHGAPGAQSGTYDTKLARIAKAATNATPTDIGPANLQDVVTDGAYVYYGNGAKLTKLKVQ